jgi:hypothetical protein
LRAKKNLSQLLTAKRYSGKKTILFVVGCQRSGTTLMTGIFEKDFGTKVYGEFSPLSSRDAEHKIRLNPLDLVQCEIDRAKVPLVVSKPLVETQNTLKLLDFFPNSKALWMYRNYKDVALSNLKHFGMRNGINNLRPIVQSVPLNWRSENVSEVTREMVTTYFSEDMDPYDAAALFWVVRNRFFFELALDRRPTVMMCRYEDLVVNPTKNMRDVYRFLSCAYPSDDICRDIRAESSGKGAHIKLSPAIDLLCRELLGKLDVAYALSRSA